MSILPHSIYHKATLLLGFATDQNKIRKQLKKQHYKTGHLGKVPQEDLINLLAHADAFLMPNIPISGDMEGFGLVCLEASLSGTLVVASELEGITDAVGQNVNSILIPTLNSPQWIQKLQSIFNEHHHYKALKEEFRQNTKELFSWNKMCNEYIEVFKQLTI